MSTQYKSSRDVPTGVLAARLNELADVVSQKRDRIGAEFTMRIPAECDRDADLVMAEAARRLSAAPDVAGLVEALEDIGASWHGVQTELEKYMRNVARRALAAYRKQGGEA